MYTYTIFHNNFMYIMLINISNTFNAPIQHAITIIIVIQYITIRSLNLVKTIPKFGSCQCGYEEKCLHQMHTHTSTFTAVMPSLCIMKFIAHEKRLFINKSYTIEFWNTFTWWRECVQHVNNLKAVESLRRSFSIE